MSTLVTNTITGLTTATSVTMPTTTKIGTTAIVSASAGSATIIAEGGTNTTNIQQGLAKMWIHFDGTGSQAVGDSFNHASITDSGVGLYTVVFTNNMVNDDYSIQYTAKAVNTSNGSATYVQTFATSSVASKHFEDGTNRDSTENTFTLNGDLA